MKINYNSKREDLEEEDQGCDFQTGFSMDYSLRIMGEKFLSRFQKTCPSPAFSLKNSLTDEENRIKEKEIQDTKIENMKLIICYGLRDFP